MRIEQILAIGFVAAANCYPRTLEELAKAAGFEVVDGAAPAVVGWLIVLPSSTPERARSAFLADVMGAAAHRWAGSPNGATPADIARAIEVAVSLNRVRAAS